jgi:tetratricopeptide (TPR) repeat protein
VVNKLRTENEELKCKMREQQDSLRQYAKEYLQMGNDCITQAHSPKAAVANFDKAIKLCPDFVDAWVRRGVTLADMGDLYEAEVSFNKAIALSPADFRAYYNRGKLRLKQEHPQDALSDLDKATSLKPTHAGAHELFGDALARVGDEAAAAIQWRIAEELRKRKKR